ncbi:MAG: hypothetical protein ACOCRO_10575 [Halanaerobiales bacterium]
MLNREEIIVKYVKERGFKPALITENNGRKVFTNFDNNYAYERVIVKNPFAELGVSANNLFIIVSDKQIYDDVPVIYDTTENKYYHIFKRPLPQLRNSFAKEIKGIEYINGMKGFPLPRINPGISIINDLKDIRRLKTPSLDTEIFDELKELDQQLEEQTRNVNIGMVENMKKVKENTDTQRKRR